MAPACLKGMRSSPRKYLKLYVTRPTLVLTFDPALGLRPGA